MATGYLPDLYFRKTRNYENNLYSSKRVDRFRLKFLSGNQLQIEDEFEILVFSKSLSKTCLIYVQKQFKCIIYFFYGSS